MSNPSKEDEIDSARERFSIYLMKLAFSGEITHQEAIEMMKGPECFSDWLQENE